MEQVILSIDLKSFYASVECLDRNLDPFSTPLVVADEERGDGTIVLAASPYIKEKYGVPSRCRLYEVDKNIPGLIIARPRMERYLKVSAIVNMIYLNYVSEEDLYVYSIDESFLDITHYLKHSKNDPVSYAKKIVKEIKDKTGLTVTCGIGSNIFMAKVAMDVDAKHREDLIAYWKEEDIVNKLWEVTPLSKMWGIGNRLEKRLNKLGMYKVGDIASSSKEFMIKKFGVIGEEMYYHSLGYDDAIISNKIETKNHSLSAGQVLLRNYSYDEVVTLIKSMSIELSDRMYEINAICNNFHMYLNFDDNTGISYKFFSSVATSSSEIIGDGLSKLYLKDIDKFKGKKFRGVYLVACNIYSNDIYQISLFEDEEIKKKQKDLDKTLISIRKKYGCEKAMPCSAITSSSTFIDRYNQIGGHHK